MQATGKGSDQTAQAGLSFAGRTYPIVSFVCLIWSLQQSFS